MPHLLSQLRRTFNLSRFFRATGFVRVLVAAGIVVNALHTAHEAGWLQAGQGRTVDLWRLVAPGTIRASVLTGLVGQGPVWLKTPFA